MNSKSIAFGIVIFLMLPGLFDMVCAVESGKPGIDDYFLRAENSTAQRQVKDFRQEIYSVLGLHPLNKEFFGASEQKIFQLVVFRNEHKGNFPVAYKLTLKNHHGELANTKWFLKRKFPCNQAAILQHKTRSLRISQEQAENLFRLVDSLGFWSAEPEVPSAGDDGASWFLESKCSLKGYRSIERWEGGEFKILAEALDKAMQAKP